MKNFANQFNNSDDIDSRIVIMAYAKSLIAGCQLHAFIIGSF